MYSDLATMGYHTAFIGGAMSCLIRHRLAHAPCRAPMIFINTLDALKILHLVCESCIRHKHHVAAKIYVIRYTHYLTSFLPSLIKAIVRLGKSGLKVSKIILGCMSYGESCASRDPLSHKLKLLTGSSGWQSWILDEKESIKHIKAAYVYISL